LIYQQLKNEKELERLTNKVKDAEK
jgi:hypothetical protein